MDKVYFAALSPQAQVAIVFGVVSVYLMGFFLLYPLVGGNVFIISVAPVVAVGWFWGSWAGILTGFLILLLNTLLLNLAGRQDWGVLSQHSGGVLGTFALVFVGAVIGGLRDLSVRLHREHIECKRVGQKLKESEKQYRDLYEEAPYAYLSIGDDKRILMSNHRASELFGYGPDDLIGTSVFDLYEDTEAGKEKARNLFQRFDAGEEIHDEEMLMRGRDGELIWISLTRCQVVDRHESPFGVPTLGAGMPSRVGQEVVEGRDKKGPEPAPLGVRLCQEVLLHPLGEEGLCQVLCLLVAMSLAAHVAVHRLPVALDHRVEHGHALRPRQAARRRDLAPTRGRERLAQTAHVRVAIH